MQNDRCKCIGLMTLWWEGDDEGDDNGTGTEIAAGSKKPRLVS